MHSLGRLDGATTTMPDVDLLLYTFVRKEAVLSSQIEGTQSTLDELLVHEVQAVPGALGDDVREVSRYVDAMNHGLERIAGGFPLTNRLLREMHGILLAEGRGAQKQPGEFRRSQNWIGGSRPGNAAFVPPPPTHLEGCLANLEQYLHHPANPVVKAALAHLQFETIHPFLDGNGRVGRLLITLFLIEQKILPAPLLYLSAFFEATRRDYYEGLRGVSESGAWNDWLEYFLIGVARTSQDALSRASRINVILAQWQRDVAGESTNTPLRIVDLLAANPFITATGIAGELGVAFTTAQRAIGRLERVGILKRATDAKRDRVYCAQALLEILEEPANPTGPIAE